MEILELYNKLYDHYGPQGWWPLRRCGYHPKIYLLTLTQDEIFEVVLGSILTQNTTFISVQKSLSKLENLGAISSHAI
ncbi:MAG: endonuclease III domain-containing protein, partial [Sulfurimonadaceae bacterium]|nr:endonuclease III domain-containing protein [Sulfurimonadaceae bacterium]